MCALITLCEITTVTTAVWATPCFPGHLGHQLPVTASALSLSGTTAHNESSPHRAGCSDSSETLLVSIIASFPFPSCHFPQHFQVLHDACGHLRFIDGRGVQHSLGHHRWVSGWWWRGFRGGCSRHCGVSPLQQCCQQQMEP